MQGPLVGKKRSSLEITEEYAKADPIYVAKTSVGSLMCTCLDNQLTCLLRHYLRYILTTAL
jgi:hypothetical protein